MLLGGYIKLARASMKSARWRSLLTMLGIIIGIVSVVTTVSIGEGVRQQIIDRVDSRGDDLITIVPGGLEQQNGINYIRNLSPAGQRAVAFTNTEYQALKNTEQVEHVAPFGHVSGEVRAGDQVYNQAQVVATSSDLPQLLNQDLAFGTFFTDDTSSGPTGVVIGQTIAEQLFGENVPLGKTLTIRGHDFIVRSIFDEFSDATPLVPTDNFDNTIFVPYGIGQELMGGNLQIYQMLAKPVDSSNVDGTIEAIENKLLEVRGGQMDFSVLKYTETLTLASDVLNLLTSLIAGVAAISLLVGGIGIMNIMLVSVTERTQEIGIRKAVGATNRQILYQFMTEAAVLSFTGGVLGVLISLLVNYFIRVFTDLQPVITLDIVLIASGVSFAVGLIFGVAPAVIAARKDPIDALRYE